jgi:two-component system OmpR family sensor kinase
MPSDAPRTRPRRPGLSVRTRITATVAALVLLALSAAGAIIYTLESARVEALARAQADQEIAEFRTLQQDGVDPRTTRPFSSSEDLLDVFLTRNVPSDDELLIGWMGDRARFVSVAQHSALAEDPALEATVAELLPTGSERTIDTAYGEVLVTVQPVQESTGQRAGLVVVTFMDDARAELHSLVRTYAVVSLLSLAAIVAIAAWVAGRLLSPIRRLNETARAISATDLSARLPVSGNDDITDLTVTVNEMLDRLEAAFAAQRQFLDDAGHELKTPLTVLRGHLELLDQGDAAERAETRELLLDETDRMSRLVGDLILLAKSRRPDFLVVDEVDLETLTQSVLAKATALGDRDWQLDETAHGEVVLDEQRVTQALLQLADNAVKHTDAGAVVAIGSSLEDGTVRLWVRDTGDGIPAEDRESVVERFGRSHVRAGDDGFGLGLSIVSAITEAHGGTVRITDAEPHGTQVEIVLPARRMTR